MVVGVLASLALQPAPQIDPFSVVDSCYVVTTANGSLGTGFLVDDGFVVTAAHVVGNSKSVSLRTSAPMSIRFSGKVLLSDSRLDIAIIELNKPTTQQPLKMSRGLPSVNEVVYAVGSPVGGLVASRGVVVSLLPTRIESNTPIDSGSSGGPLINESGTVDGVVVQMNEFTRHAFSVPGSTVQSVVDRARNLPPINSQPSNATSVPTSLTNLEVLVWVIALVLLLTILAFIIGITHGKSHPKRIIITLEKE